MSRGYFDWVPKEIGIPHLRMAVSIEINFDKLGQVMRKKLHKAVETGILPSYSGQLAALYRTIAIHYGWPRAHMWTKSGYFGCRFYVPRAVFEKEIAPYLAMLCTSHQRPVYITNVGFITAIGGPTLKHHERVEIVSSMGKFATPTSVVDSVIKHDVRNKDQVQQVLDWIDNRSSGYFKQLIS